MTSNSSRTIPAHPEQEIYRHSCTSACGESCDGEGWYWLIMANVDTPVGPFDDAMLAAQAMTRFLMESK